MFKYITNKIKNEIFKDYEIKHQKVLNELNKIKDEFTINYSFLPWFSPRERDVIHKVREAIEYCLLNDLNFQKNLVESLNKLQLKNKGE